MLDEFRIVLHSSDSIAPVGVIHPLAFHLENKEKDTLSSGNEKVNDLIHEKVGSVIEVEGDCLKRNETTSQSTTEITDLVEVKHGGLHISRTKNDNTFSISCWLLMFEWGKVWFSKISECSYIMSKFLTIFVHYTGIKSLTTE